jgi:hypothetical protein
MFGNVPFLYLKMQMVNCGWQTADGKRQTANGMVSKLFMSFSKLPIPILASLQVQEGASHSGVGRAEFGNRD